jgi:O-antigen/teichoic acid export membrane protein
MFLLACIVLNYPYIVGFIKTGDALLQFQPVLWIMGLGILFDVITGFNGHIIALSKYFKFNIVVMLFLAILNISLNYLAINYWHLGLVGVALATATSLILYNLIKLSFNYCKFKIHPFSVKIALSFMICGFALAVAKYCPDCPYAVCNILYKSLLLTFLVFLGNQYFSIFPLQNFINKGFLGKLLK